MIVPAPCDWKHRTLEIKWKQSASETQSFGRGTPVCFNLKIFPVAPSGSIHSD